MISQRFKVVSPESPRMAEIELLKGGWHVFLTWKYTSPSPSRERPVYVRAKDKYNAKEIADAWVDSALRPEPKRVLA